MTPPAVVPGRTAAAAPVQPTADELAFLTGARRYRSYSLQVRNTAAWLIGALAAVGAVVFGAGPVLKTPTLDWSTDALQLGLAGLAGLAGLGGVVFLIWTIATSFLPQEVTLGTLPTELVAEIDAEPGRTLPVGLGLTSVESFRRGLVQTRLAVASARAQAAVAAAEAKQPGASDAVKLTSAKMTAALERPVTSLQVLEDFRAELIERGEYLRKKQQWAGLQQQLTIASALAVVGIIGFPLALSSPAEPADDAAAASASGATPVVATTMTAVPGPAAESLWSALSLADCEAADGVVPVLLLGGKGTPSDPHKVQTIPTSTCAATTFHVLDAVAVVDLTEPVTATITYTPAPTATTR